jgi:hypothetical protein
MRRVARTAALLSRKYGVLTMLDRGERGTLFLPGLTVGALAVGPSPRGSNTVSIARRALNTSGGR